MELYVTCLVAKGSIGTETADNRGLAHVEYAWRI